MIDILIQFISSLIIRNRFFIFTNRFVDLRTIGIVAGLRMKTNRLGVVFNGFIIFFQSFMSDAAIVEVRGRVRGYFNGFGVVFYSFSKVFSAFMGDTLVVIISSHIWL